MFLNVHLSLTPSKRARRRGEGLEVKGRGRMSKDEVRRLVEDARQWAVDCRAVGKRINTSTTISPVERLGGEIASFLVKIGGIIALVLGVLDILKGIVLLVLANVIGGFLGSILPGLGWLLNLIPIGGSILSAVYIVAGAVIAAVGYTLVKMPVPPPAEEKSRWVLILAVLAALALAFGSYATLLALALALAGLLLAPTVKPTAPPPPSGPVKVQPS